jgi:bifunctional NMN adenylyltransferase/nudix hydrolase
MTKQYDLAVAIGRFQGGVHRGHLKLFKTAQDIASHTLICVGSSGIARSIKNPFSFAERKSMIQSVIGSRDFPYAADSAEPLIAAIRDQPYNDTLWVRKIQQAVEQAYAGSNVVLVGHKKDDTSYYLDMFPNYDYVGVDPVYLDQSTIDATTVRELLFDKKSLPSLDMVPANVINWLHSWKADHPTEFQNLCDEYKYIKDYKETWASAPFQPTFVTTDAVVICSGHILLVKRRMAPGKGLWALPGGFLAQGVTVRENIFKELEEETRIKVPRAELERCLRNIRVFDNPNRSLRGRTITHAGFINLGFGKIPRTRGADDAERTWWCPINKFINDLGDQMFEDHWDIGTTHIYS